MTRRIIFGRAANYRRQLGETADNTGFVRIDDEYVSPAHCAVTQHDDGRFTITDLGSMNGTTVVSPGGRTRPVKAWTGPEALHIGDRIRIGRTTLPWMVDR